jgi:hypothetical protein
MYKTISVAAMVLALATGGSTMLGGTAQASTGAHDGVATVTTCYYTFYMWGQKMVIPCPAPASNGGTATNNCNANCYASATGTPGKP